MRKATLLVIILNTLILNAQKDALNWYLKSYSADKTYGTAANSAYELLKNKTPNEVIVAVIDNGVEVDHEDLKDVIWVNEDEIPDNGIDDDDNGYIDDVHGWSFLGGKGGDINYESLEFARLYHIWNNYFNDVDTNNLTEKDKPHFKEYKKLRSEYTKEQFSLKMQIDGFQDLFQYIDKVKKEYGQFNKKTNKSFKPSLKEDKRIRRGLKLALMFMDSEELEKELRSAGEMFQTSYKMNNNPKPDSLRKAIVGDNPEDPNEKYYGCNRYEGPDAMHGTHVAGIIAASHNDIGIKGVSNKVKIMALRAVPNGDERDKDIANAIIYAVDNGAQVINMSFGKYFTRNKSVVDKAIKYADAKGVLLVHAAGNDAKNTDYEDIFPTAIPNDGKKVNNWIQVGASSSSKKKKKIIARFSNYGSNTVDLFAPGVNIYSTVPDNKYEDASGTSMASPVVSGVAALIWSYFPELSAQELKDVILKTIEPYSKKVRCPGSKEKVYMKDLCKTGGFVSAENAIRHLLNK